MKSRARSVLLRLANAAARKALVIVAVASLVIVTAGMGVWTHKAYAAKAKAEKAAEKQAATLNDVMAKLNKIESEMQGQTQNLNAKLEALEYQNAKLAAYEVRQQGDSARLQLASYHMPIGPAMAMQSSSLEIPLELETEVCAKGNLEASAKLDLEGDLKVHAEGEVGAEAFGNGVNADLDGEIDGKLPFDIGGGAALEKNTCLKLAKFNIFGSAPTITEQQFVNAIANVTDGKALADKLAEVFNGLPQLTDSAATSAMDALNNFSTSLSSSQFLANLENPKTVFQNVSNVLGSLPMPSAISNFFQDPSSLFPKPSDFNATNFCANQGSGGLLSNACNVIPSAVASLNGIQTTIGQFANVQGDLTNFKTSLGNICGGINSGLTAINNTSINIPTLASFTFVDGINFKIPPSFSTRTVTVGPATITTPIHVPTLSCSGL